MKRSRLRSNPAKVRAWTEKSRTPLSRGVPKVRERIPEETRAAVKARSGGKCVMCRERPITDLHHVLPVRAFPQWTTAPGNLAGVCDACHDEHERAHRRIPYGSLPHEVHMFLLGVCATDREALAFVERTYNTNLP